MPSKSLLSQAHRPDAGSRDLSAAMAQVHAAIATIEPIDSPADLRRNGVTVVHGNGQFTGPNRLSVGGDDVRFRHAVGRTEGFSRLVLDSKGRIVGASVVGPRAGESLAKAALAQVQDDLASPWVRRVIRLLGALRRRLRRA